MSDRDEGGIQVQKTLDQMRVLDDLLVSWAGWDYKTYSRKTGWGEGLFDESSGLMRRKMQILYSRPYAQAVVGTIKKMHYDDETHEFTLVWISNSKDPKKCTQLFLSQKYHYPDGYRVQLDPPSFYERKGDLLLIPSFAQGQWIELKILSNA